MHQAETLKEEKRDVIPESLKKLSEVTDKDLEQIGKLDNIGEDNGQR